MDSGGQEDPAVARLVRLHHRRRGWAWVAGGSTAGLVAYTAIGVTQFSGLTGTAGTLSVTPVLVTLALALAGLAAVIADSLRIRRAGAALRASAKGAVSHYPLYAHAHRYPPRHFASWAFGIVMLAAMTGVTAAALPAEVNSAAYLAGAEDAAAFNPMSYSQACSKSGCRTVTDGYLSGSGTDVTWDGQVTLGQPLAVRAPAWAWGTGRNIISGDGTAIALILAGLFFDAMTALLVSALAMVVRHRIRAARGQGMPVPAGAGAPGTRRARHHPGLP